jgi:hypothetical protein
LDCDHLELVVTLTCPQCNREILLEVETPQGSTSRAVLTVMEGPYWVGEQFILPVGADVAIGTASGNWLSLEGDDIAEVHCRLTLSPEGRVSIEDQHSASGTWLADQRILRGRLKPLQSFRIGEFRFRLDLQTPDGSAAGSPARSVLDTDDPPLPALERVTPLETPGLWLTRNRFHVSRCFMLAFAWLTGIYHACSLLLRAEKPWPLAAACCTGAAILVVLTVCGHRVTLAHRIFRFASLAVLAILAVADIAWGMPVPGAAGLVLAAALAMLIIQVPSQPLAVFAALLGIASATTMTVLAIQGLTEAIATRW